MEKNNKTKEVSRTFICNRLSAFGLSEDFGVRLVVQLAVYYEPFSKERSPITFNNWAITRAPSSPRLRVLLDFPPPTHSASVLIHFSLQHISGRVFSRCANATSLS